MKKTIGRKVLLWRERGWGVLQRGHLIMTSRLRKHSAATREKEIFGECQSVGIKL